MQYDKNFVPRGTKNNPRQPFKRSPLRGKTADLATLERGLFYGSDQSQTGSDSEAFKSAQ